MPTVKPPAGAWQRMLSGRRLNLLEPSPLDIEIEDIAHGLARVARWNGQTKGSHAFSVAQHCMLVERLAIQIKPTLTREARLIALLHDAPEYVIGDLISPFKRAVGINYKDMENRLLEAIHVRFGITAKVPDALHKIVKRADAGAAYFEATQLAGFDEAEAKRFFGEPKGMAYKRLTPWDTTDAQTRFVKRFKELAAAA
jgi:5'-deoxynucleotidase YfbR-like HD superfamily hydrolase